MNKQTLTDRLPHGSGINGDWHIEETNKKIKASNFYDCMNEAGYYDGIAYFTLHIPKHDVSNFKLHFNGKESQYCNRKYMLRDYLEDMIAFSLS